MLDMWLVLPTGVCTIFFNRLSTAFFIFTSYFFYKSLLADVECLARLTFSEPPRGLEAEEWSGKVSRRTGWWGLG